MFFNNINYAISYLESCEGECQVSTQQIVQPCSGMLEYAIDVSIQDSWYGYLSLGPGMRCSSMVKVFAHGVMDRHIESS